MAGLAQHQQVAPRRRLAGPARAMGVGSQFPVPGPGLEALPARLVAALAQQQVGQVDVGRRPVRLQAEGLQQAALALGEILQTDAGCPQIDPGRRRSGQQGKGLQAHRQGLLGPPPGQQQAAQVEPHRAQGGIFRQDTTVGGLSLRPGAPFLQHIGQVGPGPGQLGRQGQGLTQVRLRLLPLARFQTGDALVVEAFRPGGCAGGDGGQSHGSGGGP